MNTQISTKLTALAVALMMNGALIGGVGFLFHSQLQQHAGVMSVAHSTARPLLSRV